MARPKNSGETIVISISTTPVVRTLLEALVHYGLYGRNVAEAADRLLNERLKQLEEGDGRLAEMLKAAHDNLLSTASRGDS